MTFTISDEELEQMVRAELVNRICNEIEMNWFTRGENDYGHISKSVYKRELGEAVRKIFKDNQKLVDDAVERASKYLYEKGKSVLINGEENGK